jgi:uncharacterized caspase-like protein
MKHSTILRLGWLAALLTLPGSVATHAASGGTSSSARVALVIGNNAYKGVPTLARAGNDAKSMAAALQRLGFTTTLLTDATRRRMNKAVNDFAEGIAGGGVGVLFFAGHGVQIDNQNFLLPVDIEAPERDTDVPDQAISLQGIQDKLAQVHAKFALMIIDACRDNPLPRKAGRSIGGMRGLTQPTAPNGQVIIFSAGANETALDSLSPSDRDANGLFTREFLPVLNTPGLSVSEALRVVRKGVIAKANSVNHDQHPAIYDQSDGDFYFKPGPAEDTSSATAAPAAPAGSGPAETVHVESAEEREQSFWNLIKDTRDAADFADYQRQYPNGAHAAEAALMARKLSRGSKTADAPAPSGAVPPSAPPAPLAAAAPSAPPVPTYQAAVPGPGQPMMPGASAGAAGAYNGYITSSLQPGETINGTVSFSQNGGFLYVGSNGVRVAGNLNTSNPANVTGIGTTLLPRMLGLIQSKYPDGSTSTVITIRGRIVNGVLQGQFSDKFETGQLVFNLGQ